MKESHQFQTSYCCCMKSCLSSVSQNYIEPYLLYFYSLTQMLTFFNLGVFLSTILCTYLPLRKVHNREGFYILSRIHSSRYEVLYSRELLSCMLGALSQTEFQVLSSSTKSLPNKTPVDSSLNFQKTHLSLAIQLSISSSSQDIMEDRRGHENQGVPRSSSECNFPNSWKNEMLVVRS